MAQEKGKVLIEKNKNGTGKVATANPHRKDPNVAQGPRSGNTGTPAKRSQFQAAKSDTGSERSELARFVMDALAGRGAGMQGKIDKTVEPLSADRGPKRNPTAGGTHYKMTGRK